MRKNRALGWLCFICFVLIVSGTWQYISVPLAFSATAGFITGFAVTMMIRK